jgi:hypothetical protein
VLKENKNTKLFKYIFPGYLVVFCCGIVLAALLSLVISSRGISIVLFSFTLVLAELFRRKGKSSLYIFMCGGFQYSIQCLVLLNHNLTTIIGIDLLILTSVTIPFLFLVWWHRRLLAFSISRLVSIPMDITILILKESVGQMFFNLTTILNNWLGTYLLSVLGNNEGAAIFSAVKRIANGLSFPQQVLNINFANPLARNLNNPDKLNHIVSKQRKFFFYAATLVSITAFALAPFLTKLINVTTEMENTLYAVYAVLMAMVVLNILSGPTFIFARLSGNLGKNVMVILAITIMSYGFTLIWPVEHQIILMSVAAFSSMTTINAYLLFQTWRTKGILLNARP